MNRSSARILWPLGTILVSIAASPLTPAGQAVWHEETVERDMTGDGQPETLVLRATGDAPDSLDVVFAVEASTGTLYTAEWSSDLYFFYEQPIDSIPRAEIERRVREQFNDFFAPSKFGETQDMGESNPDVDEALGYYLTFERIVSEELAAGADSASARLEARRRTRSTDTDWAEVEVVWRDMLRHNMPTFTFFSGGEHIRKIAWSPLRRRFYVIWSCC